MTQTPLTTLALTLVAAQLKNTLGQQAAKDAIALFTQTPTLLEQRLTIPKISAGSCLELAFMTGNAEILKSLTTLPKPKGFPSFPYTDTWEEPHTFDALKLWYTLHNHDDKILLQLISDTNFWNVQTANLERAILTFLMESPISNETMDRLALWRLERGCKSSKNSKLLNTLFKNRMTQDPTFGPWIMTRLVAERKLPQALAWLLYIGEGEGLNVAIPTNTMPGLMAKAFSVMQSAHGRMMLADAVQRVGNLDHASAKDLNSALRLALESTHHHSR